METNWCVSCVKCEWERNKKHMFQYLMLVLLLKSWCLYFNLPHQGTERVYLRSINIPWLYMYVLCFKPCVSCNGYSENFTQKWICKISSLLKFQVFLQSSLPINANKRHHADKWKGTHWASLVNTKIKIKFETIMDVHRLKSGKLL